MSFIDKPIVINELPKDSYVLPAGTYSAIFVEAYREPNKANTAEHMRLVLTFQSGVLEGRKHSVYLTLWPYPEHANEENVRKSYHKSNANLREICEAVLGKDQTLSDEKQLFDKRFNVVVTVAEKKKNGVATGEFTNYFKYQTYDPSKTEASNSDVPFDLPEGNNVTAFNWNQKTGQ